MISLARLVSVIRGWRPSGPRQRLLGNLHHADHATERYTLSILALLAVEVKPLMLPTPPSPNSISCIRRHSTSDSPIVARKEGVQFRTTGSFYLCMHLYHPGWRGKAAHLIWMSVGHYRLDQATSCSYRFMFTANERPLSVPHSDGYGKAFKPY